MSTSGLSQGGFLLAIAVAILFAVGAFLWQRSVYSSYVAKIGEHPFNEGIKAQIEKRMMAGSWRELAQFCQAEGRTNFLLYCTAELLAHGPNRILLEARVGQMRSTASILVCIVKQFSWKRFFLNLTCLGGAGLIISLHWGSHEAILIFSALALAASLYYMYFRHGYRQEAVHNISHTGEHMQWVIDKIIHYQIPSQDLDSN